MAAVTPPSAPALPPQSLPRPAAGVFPPAERNVELKFSHWVPTAHPLHGTIQSWADSIKRASNGTIDVKVFPAQQLGKALDHYNMARDGIADITFVNPAYEPTRFPIVSRLELPFTATNATAGSVALDAWYRKYAGREMRDVKYCLSFAHDPGTLHTTKKKVVLPSDVRGMKIRPSNAVLARLVTMLGGTNVQASAPEIRGSLEKGASEGVTSPWGSVTLFGIDRVTRFHLDAPLYVSVFNWVIHPATYNALSPAQRAVLDNHCTSEWAERVARPWSDYESSGRSKVRAQPGHDIYTLSPAQIAEWRRALLPLKAEWEATVRRAGHDPVAIASDLEGELRKRNSLY
ncbi:MAG: TRAP transporter substrate-binding protein [Pseudorhodoplanes sp.]